MIFRGVLADIYNVGGALMVLCKRYRNHTVVEYGNRSFSVPFIFLRTKNKPASDIRQQKTGTLLIGDMGNNGRHIVTTNNMYKKIRRSQEGLPLHFCQQARIKKEAMVAMTTPISISA